MIEESFVSYLLDDAWVSSLVDDRIFPGGIPLKTEYPAISYRRATTRKTMSHDGPGLAGPVYDFHCWGSGERDMRELRDAVSRAFDVVTTEDFRSFVENEIDLGRLSEANRPLAVVSVRIWHDPAIAEAS